MQSYQLYTRRRIPVFSPQWTKARAWLFGWAAGHTQLQETDQEREQSNGENTDSTRAYISFTPTRRIDRYRRWRLKKFARPFIASRDSGNEGSSQKKCHIPSNTLRSASTPALRSLRCSNTDWLRHMSRVPEIRKAGG